ncbi:MAG: hypothetical protein QXM31_00090 [Candidatus Woesearchaeota archaeon]
MKRRSGEDEDTGRYNPEKDTHRCRIFGLGLAAGIALSGLAYLAFNSISEQQKQKTEQQAGTQRFAEKIKQNNPYIDFNLYRKAEGWTGMKLTIDRLLIDDWARYAPVKITIPELSYTAPFYVEQGAKSAETTFPKPVPFEGTYHYIVFGKDPVTGNAKELYRHILSPERK